MAAKSVQAILNTTVPAKNAPMNIIAVPVKNVHLKFIIAPAKNAHLNGITAAVKGVSTALTINRGKAAASIADRLLYFLAAIFNASIRRRILRKKRIKPINE